MKGLVNFLASLTCITLVGASFAFALDVRAQTQTRCNASTPYTGICQGLETYVDLDGTASTGAGTLSFAWSSDCPNADLVNPNTSTPTLILYNPGLGIAASCKVYLEINDSGACGCHGNCTCVDQCEAQVNISACARDCEGTINGTKVVDRCGVCGGDGNSCLGCSNVDITSEQFTLDGNNLALKNLIRNANKTLAQFARSTKDVKFVAKTDKASKQVYVESWTYAWSLPSISTTCVNQVFCTSTSNAGIIEAFTNSSDTLNNMLKSVVKRTQKLRGRVLKGDNRLLAKGDIIHQQNLTVAATIPPSVSACTRP